MGLNALFDQFPLKTARKLNVPFSSRPLYKATDAQETCKTKIFTARKRSLGQGNIFIGVCQEYLGRYPPGTRYIPLDQVQPPGADTPQDQVHPPTRYTPTWDQTPPMGADTPPLPPARILGDTVNARAVSILLECNLVQEVVTGLWGCGDGRGAGEPVRIHTPTVCQNFRKPA